MQSLTAEQMPLPFKLILKLDESKPPPYFGRIKEPHFSQGLLTLAILNDAVC